MEERKFLDGGFVFFGSRGKTKNLKPISQGFELREQKTEQQSPKSVCVWHTTHQHKTRLLLQRLLDSKEKKKVLGVLAVGVNVAVLCDDKL